MPTTSATMTHAIAALRSREWGDAEGMLLSILEHDPRNAQVLNLLGVALQQQKRTLEALRFMTEACLIAPENAEFHSNRAATLLVCGRYVEAEASARKAVALDPRRADAIANLGTAQRRQGQVEEAVESFRRAAALRPDVASYRNNLGDLLLRLGRIDEAIPELRAVVDAYPDNFKARSDLIMTLNYSDAVRGRDLLDQAVKFGRIATAKAAHHRIDASPPAPVDGRLRIGFVSGDLRQHAVAQFLEAALDGLRSSGHELYAYQTRDSADDVTARLLPRFAGWRPIFSLGDREAAECIAADGIHLLIDLSGHTGSNRLPLFARRPAPIAATWIGYSGTTGVREIDYVIADGTVLPMEDEPLYSERPWRLPHCYLLFNPPPYAPGVPALPFEKAGVITFGSFNNLAKLAGTTLDTWARLLAAMPDSRLVLKSPALSTDEADRVVAHRLVSRGVARDRIDVIGRIADTNGHLSAYERIDIALDPFPYAGTTTTFEALWMGRPVVTLRGDRFTARVGDSILSNLGLGGWVADGIEDYVRLAIDKARDHRGLVELSATLRERMRLSPLCDAPLFAKGLNDAVEGMWRTYSLTQPSQST